MKILLFLILPLTFIMLTLVPNSVAEDSPQWHLPEGIIARLGKGTPTDVQYSPDGTHLAVATETGIWIYDADTGKELDLLTDDEIGTWDGENEGGEPVASGVYFYTLTAGDFTATRKMLIRK